MEHSDCFIDTVDFETYLLIDKLESIYWYYFKYGDFDLYYYAQNANLRNIETQLKKLSPFQLILVLIRTGEKLEATVNEVLKTDIQKVVDIVETLLKKITPGNINPEQAIPLEDADLDKLTLEMLILSKEKNININPEEAKVISEFVISQICVNDLDERLNKKNGASKHISKTDLLKQIQLVNNTSSKKEKTSYQIMNRMIPTEKQTSSTKNKAQLNPRHAYYLKILLMNYEEEYFEYLYSLSNPTRKKNPKIPSIDVFKKAKDNMVSYYEKNPMIKNFKGLENDLLVQKLLNQQFVEDTNHFSILFLTTKILTDFSKKLLSNVNDLNNEDENSLNNNLFLSIFLKIELRNYNEYSDRMNTRYTKFAKCIDDLLSKNQGIVDKAKENNYLVKESVEGLLTYLDNTNSELGNSTDEDYSEYFKKVVESFYDVNNPNNPFKK